MKYTIVSYIPFFEYNHGNDIEKVVKAISSQDIFVHGCLWSRAKEDGPIELIFIVDRANDLQEHMSKWADGASHEMFSLLHYKEGFKYSVMVSPNLEASCKRYFGGDPPNGSDIAFVFKPVYFYSNGVKESFYHKIFSELMGMSSIRFGFVEFEDFKKNSTGAKVYWFENKFKIGIGDAKTFQNLFFSKVN